MRWNVGIILWALAVSAADARTPDWMIVCGDCGLLNTKPNQHGECLYRVYGKEFKLRKLRDVEIIVQQKWFFWEVNVKKTFRSTWRVEISPLTPPQMELGDVIMQYQREQIVHLYGDEHDVTNWEQQPIDWVVVNDMFVKTNAILEEEWRDDIKLSFVRVCGERQDPAGMLVVIIQEAADTIEHYEFIVDQDSMTVWKRP